VDLMAACQVHSDFVTAKRVAGASASDVCLVLCNLNICAITMGGVGVAELAHPSAFASSLLERVDKLRLFGLKDFIACFSASCIAFVASYMLLLYKKIPRKN